MAPAAPSRAVAQVADVRPASAGRFRVERLKEDDFLRLWCQLAGRSDLIHRAMAPRSPAN
jgi:hypothetical protein